MTGERTQLQWTVRIDGVDQQTVKPGESVEIGRKPLRPLPDDGTRRLEIADGTRSMSKRHASFTVSQSGGGTVRDLGSTNGSYVVRGNGDLMRLPPQTDFLLPTSPMRLQFGDVPVDFIRVEQPVSDTFVVPDLFGYALNTVKQEPDVADMSVDDILDLRAGEPTAAISAANVRKRVGELNAAAVRDAASRGTAGEAVSNETVSARAAQPDSTALPSTNEAQPHAVQPVAESVEQRQQTATPAAAQPSHDDEPEPSQEQAGSNAPAEQSDVESTDAARNTPDRSVAGPAASVALPERPEPSVPLNVSGTAAKPVVALPRDLFADAIAHSEAERTAQRRQEAARLDAAQQEATVNRDSAAQQDAGTIRQAVQEAAQYAAGVVVVDAVTNDSVQDVAVQGAEQSTAQGASGEQSQPAEVPQEHRRFMPQDGTAAHDDAAGQTTQSDSVAAEASSEADSTAFKPAFEPGSVFDLVSKGALNRSEPKIEIDGYTSDQAKTTDDYNEQFEIANRRELLPFLAMNPSLYDEMYSWLEAQGNADVDAALENNEGYKDYRKAVGK